jgi:cysteine desulfurase
MTCATHKFRNGVDVKHIYLDHNATTPLDAEVAAVMKPFLHDQFGNPSSLHKYGREAKVAVEDAREKVATILGIMPREVYFTSSGTESNNWALQGVAEALKTKGNHIVTSVIEHSSVLETCYYLERQGFNVSYVASDHKGLVHESAVQDQLTEKTVLVSIMYANNEVGTINPITLIGELVQDRGILFHTDAVQVFGHFKDKISNLPIDLMSISAHKFYGPKGVGVLYIRAGSKIARLLHGGGHERRMRAGTENVAGIVGMGKAAELVAKRSVQDNKRLRILRDELWQGINENITDVVVNGDPDNGLPGLLNCSFLGVEGESIVLSLDMKGIAVSAGSACAAGTMEPSHVLEGMKLKPEVVKGAVRFSLGRENQAEDVETVVNALVEVIERLRRLSPAR